MFFKFKKKESGLTQSQIDYANELYRTFNGRPLKPEEINKETVERIIAEYSGKLYKSIMRA